MHEVKVKLQDDLYQKLTEHAEKNNISIAEVIRDSIRSYLEKTEPQTEQMPTLRMIITKYKSRCSKSSWRISYYCLFGLE